MGAGDGSVAGCDSTGGKHGHLPVHGARHLHRRPASTRARRTSRTSAASGTTRATSRTCSPASRRSARSGCGFEHQFAAITRALGADGRAAPAENQGFLRPDAYLAIVMITNEDDCSASPGVPLFDTGSNTNIASQLGPPANFRCNEFGHLCDDGAGNLVHPNRNAPNNDVNASVSYASCTSNDAEGYLLSVRDTANRIKALKADDGQVMVAAITGAPSPYVVGWKAPSTADTSCGAASCPWPVIQHACTAADGSFADPAVRINELVRQFGANGPRSRSATPTSRPRCPTSPARSSNTSTRPASRDGSRSGRARRARTAPSPTTRPAPACPRAPTPATPALCWRLVAGATALWWRRLRLGAGKRFPGHHRGLHHVRPRHARPGARLPLIRSGDPSAPRKPHCARGQLCWRSGRVNRP